MRYQEYKNKMLKVRKVLDVFYRFRFVFIGVAVATAATITTLDLSKGTITETSNFEISYTYGDDISYSGSAIMSNVTFQFRRVGDEEWSEEEPRLVGQYEARAKSESNHGYYYSDISTFEIKPYETTINVTDASVDFGDDHPDLTYTILKGDTLKEEDVVVNYADLTKRTTTASVDLSSLKITSSDGVDVTSCYAFTAIDKDVTFNKAPITVDFVQESTHTYTGQTFSSNQFVKKSGTLYYGAHLEYTGGKSVYQIGKYNNDHQMKVVDDKGNDYTANYDIKLNDNYIQIDPAPAVTITSRDLSKTYYDGKTFTEFNNPDSLITISPGLINGHHFKLIGFTNKDVFQAGTYVNDFEYDIIDDEGNSVDRALYSAITVKKGSITIGKKPITITSKATSATFDNKYHSMPDFEKPVEGLVSGDEILVDNETYTKQFEPTSGVENKLDYIIMHNGTDVTESYEITKLYKNITITVNKLKFVFSTTPVTYDGQEHYYYYANGNYAIYDSESKRQNAALLDESYQALPDGWTYEVRIPSSFTRKTVKDDGYVPTINDIEVHIWDDSTPVKVDVKDYYTKGTDIIFEMPKAYVNKKHLDVEVGDYDKLYNNRTIEQDIIIDPAMPGSCVTYTGLVSGDVADVKFSGNAASNKNASNTPYNLSLTYGVKSSTGENVTNSYDIEFKNSKSTIDASIAKRDIVVHPTDLPKVYNGKSTFTPPAPLYNAPAGKSLLGTEEVSIKDNPTGPYLTPSPSIGTYSYELNPNDIVIKINGQVVTNNYNIFVEDSGDVSISRRTLKVSNNSSSESGSHIFYDKNPHGAFVDSNGYAKEIDVQTSNSADTVGLVTGHRLAIINPSSITNVGHLDISSSQDLGIEIYDENDANVTSNYNIYHDPFYIDIVQTKITIDPYYVSKYFDGSYFEDERFINVGFGEYKNYTSSEMLQLFGVTIESINDNQLQPGHMLQLTKYTMDCANNAVEANVSAYPFYYGFRIIDTNDNNRVIQEYPELDGIYAVTAPQGLNLLGVNKAIFRINCNSGGKRYDGKVGVPPKSGSQFALDTDHNADAYISNFDAGQKFFNNFSINAQFNTGVYDPEDMWMANGDGESYQFPVTITISDLRTDTHYAENGVSSIQIIKNKSYYDYKISKSALVLSTVVSSDGRELRKYTGALASTDKLCFGTIGDYDIWENRRKEYRFPLGQFLILRNGVDVTTSCYSVTVNYY